MVATPPVPLRQAWQGSLTSFSGKTPFQLVVRQHPPHRRSFIQGTAALASSSLAENSVDFQSVRFFSVKYPCQRAPAVQSPQISLFTFPSSKIISGLFRTPCRRQNPSSVTSWVLGGTRPSVHSAATESPKFQAHSCGWGFSSEQKQTNSRSSGAYSKETDQKQDHGKGPECGVEGRVQHCLLYGQGWRGLSKDLEEGRFDHEISLRSR